MGYCIDLSENNFKIKKENADYVVIAIRNYALTKEGRMTCIDKRTLIDSVSIEESFEEFNFPLAQNENNDYIIDYFSGEKLSDDYYPMFKAIAPYVEDGYIEMVGEDGDKWRWVFKNGVCKEIYPKVIWDE